MQNTQLVVRNIWLCALGQILAALPKRQKTFKSGLYIREQGKKIHWKNTFFENLTQFEESNNTPYASQQLKTVTEILSWAPGCTEATPCTRWRVSEQGHIHLLLEW